MQPKIEITHHKMPLLERFGIYYLQIFEKKNLTHHVFDYSDAVLKKAVDRITRKGMWLSALVGFICMWPTVYVDVLLAAEPWYIHYGWVALVSIIAIAIEFYILFIIALKAVHEVSELINIHATENELLQQGPFNVSNVLARAALELPDPEMNILGIDPFKRVSKKNLLILGFLYKAKIFLTNLVAKIILSLLVGPLVGGISILYIALPVECFWNAVVIRRVVREARLRLFGFALCNHIADHVLHDNLLSQLSPLAKTGCLRAIGNAVVMTQNYHPNMIILLLRFQQLLKMEEGEKLDDWNIFLKTLQSVSPKERNFLLDIFTIAAAFDGKISKLESENLKNAFGEAFALYQPRLMQLTTYLRDGKLNAAAALCEIDFIAG